MSTTNPFASSQVKPIETVIPAQPGVIEQPVAPQITETVFSEPQIIPQAPAPIMVQEPVQQLAPTIQEPVQQLVPTIQEQLAAQQPSPVEVQQAAAVQVAPAPDPAPVQVVVSTPPPALEEGQSIICQMSPGIFDSFIKVLSLLDDKNIITIEKSQIRQLINNNTAILQTNIIALCGNKEIDLHILQPKNNLKLFKAIKENNDIFIIDDIINKRYQVVSGDVRIWLPKQIEEIENAVAIPNFTSDQIIGQPIVITKEERNKISSLTSGVAAVTLLVKDNQLKGYLIPEKVEASFKQFTGEKISENNADLKLVSSAFLGIPSDGDTVISLANYNNNYWLLSKINTAMVEIHILETLQIAQNDGLLL